MVVHLCKMATCADPYFFPGEGGQRDDRFFQEMEGVGDTFFWKFYIENKTDKFQLFRVPNTPPLPKKKQQQKPGHVIHVIFGIKSSYNLNLQFSRIVKSTFIHSFGIPLKRKPLNQFLLHYAKHLEGSSLIVSLF